MHYSNCTQLTRLQPPHQHAHYIRVDYFYWIGLPHSVFDRKLFWEQILLKNLGSGVHPQARIDSFLLSIQTWGCERCGVQRLYTLQIASLYVCCLNLWCINAAHCSQLQIRVQILERAGVEYQLYQLEYQHHAIFWLLFHRMSGWLCSSSLDLQRRSSDKDSTMFSSDLMPTQLCFIDQSQTKKSRHAWNQRPASICSKVSSPWNYAHAEQTNFPAAEFPSFLVQRVLYIY